MNVEVTNQELADILATAPNTHTFAHLTAVTVAGKKVTHRETKQPLIDFLGSKTAKLCKAFRGSLSIGNDYTQAVNNARVKIGLSGDYEPKVMNTYTRYNGSRAVYQLVSNPANLYLVAFFFASPNAPANFRSNTMLFNSETGQVYDRETVAGFMDLPSKSDCQGLGECEVVFRNYKMENVHSLSYRGGVYCVSDAALPAPFAGFDPPAPITQAEAAEANKYMDEAAVRWVDAIVKQKDADRAALPVVEALTQPQTQDAF